MGGRRERVCEREGAAKDEEAPMKVILFITECGVITDHSSLAVSPVRMLAQAGSECWFISGRLVSPSGGGLQVRYIADTAAVSGCQRVHIKPPLLSERPMSLDLFSAPTNVRLACTAGECENKSRGLDAVHVLLLLFSERASPVWKTFGDKRPWDARELGLAPSLRFVVVSGDPSHKIHSDTGRS
ncbi:hypothetical protein BaRGS_00007494 [Batillaria attramentaria]|uniref:Uncharacterized protein n=1 Tax=Batillaria attramentaria TaxID=370345 RepID=A0ABD0LQS0_9CAEN